MLTKSRSRRPVPRAAGIFHVPTANTTIYARRKTFLFTACARNASKKEGLTKTAIRKALKSKAKKAILKSSLKQIHNYAEGTVYGARTYSLNSRVRTTENSR